MSHIVDICIRLGNGIIEVVDLSKQPSCSLLAICRTHWHELCNNRTDYNYTMEPSPLQKPWRREAKGGAGGQFEAPEPR